MPETQDAAHLSIGEVLGLLLEEFPDVTISKIRFLESQGLIAPERTPSGYRKFYEHDIDLLRVILREQRENYLPLRVIKDRLHSGAIDPSGEVAKPEGSALDGDASDADDHHEPAEVPAASIRSHPASRRSTTDDVESDGADTGAADTERDDLADHTPVTPQLLPGVVLDRSELCAMIGMSPSELAELENFGIVSSRSTGGATLYNDDAVEIAKVAVEFLRAGVDARHLRSWRTAAEREASLYEQLITPRLRQRNPESRAEALDQLRRLDVLGAKLRHALMRTTLRHHFET